MNEPYKFFVRSFRSPFPSKPTENTENTFLGDLLVFLINVDKQIEDEIFVRRVQRFHDGKSIDLLFF